MRDKLRRTALLCAIGGLVYCGIEIIWRGYTHWSMFLLAALLSLPLDQINEHLSWDMPFWLQAVIGGVGITVAELVAGLVLNVWLRFDVWDYSNLPGSFMGQISIQYSILWVLLAAFVIVLFDILRWHLFGEEIPRYTWRFRKGRSI